MAGLYSEFPAESFSLSEFNSVAATLCDDPDKHAEFRQFTLCGEFKTAAGARKQVFLDPSLNRLLDDEPLEIARDYDSVIGITDRILVDGPITIYAVPHPTKSLHTSIHLQREILYGEVTHQVDYHHIPNFEWGNFGPRHALHIFFPRLWTPDQSKYERPWYIPEEKRAFWYEKGLRPAIRRLLGNRVASDWPATYETEKIRAEKHRGGHSWSTKIIPKDSTEELARVIRQEITSDPTVSLEQAAWSQDFFVMHTIRGIKHATFHKLNQASAEFYLMELLEDASLFQDAPQVGEWYIDVAIEISSPEEACLQWSTTRHFAVVEQALQIPIGEAQRITELGSSKYSRDVASHLPAVSGFRIEPGTQAQGPYRAAYIQAYTTDKSTVYNKEGKYHAKSLLMREALGVVQPAKTIDGLFSIYEGARDEISSCARLEVRVPWEYATEVLTHFDSREIHKSLLSFTQDEWWNFRLLRVMAISQVLMLQEAAPADLRFSHEALLLTAVCVWLLNGLHARPQDGPASRELMDSALPVITASAATRDVLAYETSTAAENDRPIAHIPHGVVFFRRIIPGNVPRFRIGGPVLSLRSFKFWFDGMDKGQLEAKYERSGIVPRQVIRQTRSTTNRAIRSRMVLYRSPEEEGPLFSLDALGHSLADPIVDDGSDREVDEEDDLPEADDLSGSLDAVASKIWRQFVVDLTSKSPSPRGATKPSYFKLNDVQRRSGSEEPYMNLCFPQLFTDVWYRRASGDEWKTSFKWLFPPLGQQTASSAQNYGACPYFHFWQKVLQRNERNPSVIEALRSAFWKRIRTWNWMPNAQADKMWRTAAVKPAGGNFTRWPPSANPAPGPHILLKYNAFPILELPLIRDEEVSEHLANE